MSPLSLSCESDTHFIVYKFMMCGSVQKRIPCKLRFSFKHTGKWVQYAHLNERTSMCKFIIFLAIRLWLANDSWWLALSYLWQICGTWWSVVDLLDWWLMFLQAQGCEPYISMQCVEFVLISIFCIHSFIITLTKKKNRFALNYM